VVEILTNQIDFAYFIGMKHRYSLLPLLLLFTSLFAAARDITLLSPNGRVRVQISTGKGLTYAVWLGGEALLEGSVIDLEIADHGRLSDNLAVATVKRKGVRADIISPVPEKRRVVPDRYNEAEIRFRQPYRLVFRVYDDGVAYRLLTGFPDSIEVRSEAARFGFARNARTWYPAVQPKTGLDSFHTSFEEHYTVKPLDSIAPAALMFTPVLVSAGEAAKVLVTESDLEDYPGMFLRGTGGRVLEGRFAPYPLEEKLVPGEFPQYVVTRRAGYLARTKGTRAFPWRVLALAERDADLPANDLVYRLGSPSRLTDASWINPGRGTDEWIIGVNLYNVPFAAGINTATYKYYVDFARRFGLQRIMLDAGWSDNNDLFRINPDLDMDELAAYAKSQGIKLCMWTLAATLDRQLEPALDQFNRWGVDFIMTDFIDRDDQKAVNFHHRIAEACGRHKIMLMFHGSFKPAGFNRTWPHAVTREAVLGSEYNIWSHRATPPHNVELAYIRMVAGPLDYEPGLLENATRKTFRPVEGNPMSQGTRCQQLAMFVVYDSPVQFFSGNPATGLAEPAFMELLGSIPTVWDQTLIPDGRVGEYIVSARQKGDAWFLGAMTDWTARTLTVRLDFLDEGTYTLTEAVDGVNAARYAADYRLNARTVRKGDTITLNLAPGGGYVGRLVREK
jgi:alpha-glucosidase